MNRTKQVIIQHAAVVFTAVLLCVQGASAQTASGKKNNSPKDAAADSSAKDEITLPAVTTVVSGDALTAGRNAIPDFTPVLPAAGKSAVPLPQLPAVQVTDTAAAVPAAAPADDAGRIYAEGVVGGGYPGFFSGDFSVYRSDGDNPFLIKFSHAAANGYGSHSAAGGFFDSATSLTGEKTSAAKNTSLKLSGAYNTASDGLQSQSSCFFDTTQQTLSGAADFQWKLPEHFSLDFAAGSAWYTRLQGLLTGIDTSAVTAAEKSASVLSFAPSAAGAWNYNGFSLGLSAKYGLAADLNRAVTGSYAVNRGDFAFNAGWKNDTVNIYGKVGAVVSSSMNSGTAVVPFTVGTALTLAAPLSAQKVTVSAKGGLDSYQASTAELEKKYRFTQLSVLPGETSDWYGRLDVTVPVGTQFVIQSADELRSTAFGNGVWEPVYASASAVTGLSGYSQLERTQLYTRQSAAYVKGHCTASVEWVSYWIHVPANENAQTLGIKAAYEATGSRWGTDVSAKMPFAGALDMTPEIGAGGFVSIADSFRLALKAEDVVKLCTAADRVYASGYISRAGSVTLLAKFFF